MNLNETIENANIQILDISDLCVQSAGVMSYTCRHRVKFALLNKDGSLSGVTGSQMMDVDSIYNLCQLNHIAVPEHIFVSYMNGRKYQMTGVGVGVGSNALSQFDSTSETESATSSTTDSDRQSGCSGSPTDSAEVIDDGDELDDLDETIMNPVVADVADNICAETDAKIEIVNDWGAELYRCAVYLYNKFWNLLGYDV